MTKEVLEKEAEEWCEERFENYSKYLPQAYIAGAEPREKQIEELEQQIKEMRVLLEKWYNQHSDKTYTKTFYDELIKATEGFLWSDICVK